MPRGNFSRLRMHAPATTGPASGAHPASSTPASGCGKSSSSLKEQRRGIESDSCTRARAPVQTFSRQKLWKSLAFEPPRREAPRFARMIEEYDVPVGIAKARLAPHPRLVARPVLERNAAACKLLDPFVEIVALEVDGGGGEDLLLGVDLDRQGHSARGFEPGVAGLRAVDDLLQPELAVEC